MKRPDNNRIDEELVCVESFYHYMSKICYQEEIIIDREKNDPPDFWINIGNEKYAVEVTSIVKDYGYTALCYKLEEYIETFCQTNGFLFGKYVLIVMGRPKIPKRNSKIWRILVDEAVSYIKDTSTKPLSYKKIILKDNDGYISIEKLSNRGSSLGLAGPTEAKWMGEAREELSSIIQKSIIKKKRAIEKKKDLSKHNIILLLYDAYGYCNMMDAVDAFKKVVGYDWCHSVYWAASFSYRPNELYEDTPGRNGCFLYSANSEWVP